MSSRVQKWATEVFFAALLAMVVVAFSAAPLRAEQAPDQDDNEMTYDSLRLPGPGDRDPADNDGDPIAPRQGADPNDFSVSSPRPPATSVEPVARFDLLQWLRTALHFWLNRLAGPIRGA